MRILYEELATEVLAELGSLDYSDLYKARARRLHIFLLGSKELKPDSDTSKLMYDADIKGFRCIVGNFAVVFILDDEKLERVPHHLEVLIFDFAKNAGKDEATYTEKFKEEFPTEKAFLDKLYEYKNYLMASTSEYLVELNENKRNENKGTIQDPQSIKGRIFKMEQFMPEETDVLCDEGAEFMMYEDGSFVDPNRPLSAEVLLCYPKQYGAKSASAELLGNAEAYSCFVIGDVNAETCTLVSMYNEEGERSNIPTHVEAVLKGMLLNEIKGPLTHNHEIVESSIVSMLTHPMDTSTES